jgi:prolyl-tRNA synthetase
MQAEELEKYFNGPAGFLGPVGLKPDAKPLEDGLTVVVDKSLDGRGNLVAGANKLDYHLRNVTPGRDFSWTLMAEIRSVNADEGCPKDGCKGKLVVGKAVEIGHIFKLGYKYSESMGARVLDLNGKEVTPIMGSYGIGIERILTETGEKLAAELEAAGLDVLLDDREERAGVKFKDGDLVGIPYRINVGKKTAEGKVELVTRATSTSVDVALPDVVALVKERIEEDALLLTADA